MLGLRHYIGLSVAMTMVGAPDIYTALMDTVDEALQPENDEQHDKRKSSLKTE